MNRVHVTDAAGGVGSSTIRRQNTSPSRRHADRYVDVERFFWRLGYSCCKPARHTGPDAPGAAVPSRTPTGPIVASIDGSGPCGPPPASTVTKPSRERCVQPLPLCTSNALKICRKLPSPGQPLVQRWQRADTRRSNTPALPRSRCFSRVCVGSDSPRTDDSRTHRRRKPDSNSRSLWRGKMVPAVEGAGGRSKWPRKTYPLARDQWFESVSLQRGVCQLSVPCGASNFRFGSPAAVGL